MTDWNALRDSAKEPDTLEKVIADIEGALLPMMRSMLPEPTWAQSWLLVDEIHALYIRARELARGKLPEVQNGDANTDP